MGSLIILQFLCLDINKNTKMKSALMVAEKPSLALNLANILSNGKCATNKGNAWFIKLILLYSDIISNML